MSKRERPQILEVIQPDLSTPPSPVAHAGSPGFAGGHRLPSGRSSGADEPDDHRRWIVPAAIVAIVAVVVGASVFADDGPTAPRSAPTTSNQPATTTTIDAPLPAVQLIPTVPEGFELESFTIGASSPTTGAQVGVRELWASNPSTVTRSAWFLITATSSEPAKVAVGDLRVPVAAGVAVVDRRADGHTDVVAPIAGGWATITSAGVRTDQLVNIVDSLQLLANRLLHDDPLFGGMFQTVAVDRSDGFAAGGGSGDATVTYRSDLIVNGRSERLAVTTGRQASEYERLSREFFLTRRDEVSLLSGDRAEIGTDSRRPGVQTMVLDHEGTQVTLEGNVPRDVLVAAASSLHTASPVELRELRVAQRPVDATGLVELGRARVNDGTFADGTPWAVVVSTGADGTLLLVLAGENDRSASAPLPTRQPSLASVATGEYTAIVGLFDPATVGGTLRITLGGDDRPTVIETPATVVTGLPRQVQPVSIAASAFVELGPYRAELLDAAGVVLATLHN